MSPGSLPTQAGSLGGGAAPPTSLPALRRAVCSHSQSVLTVKSSLRLCAASLPTAFGQGRYFANSTSDTVARVPQDRLSSRHSGPMPANCPSNTGQAGEGRGPCCLKVSFRGACCPWLAPVTRLGSMLRLCLGSQSRQDSYTSPASLGSPHENHSSLALHCLETCFLVLNTVFLLQVFS